MIIGLTGKNGSGKGEAAKHLQALGYQYYSLSDVLREEAAKQGKAVTRENLVVLGNCLRQDFGPGVLAERILGRLDPEKNYVIDSVRHPSEAAVLKRRKDFFLVAVEASQKVRFDRTLVRQRENDPVTFDEFKKLEDREASSGKTTDQQLDETIRMADDVIQNNHSLEDFYGKIKKLILDLVKKEVRPDWDEYFMGIAKVTALRANCMKRKVAAVIVKDKRVIATGYNGTPRGIKNCYEGGCPRCNSVGVSGEGLGECLCSHAEENAIVQSAYHGVSIKDATIYTTFSPCLMCTKMIINAGLKEVVYSVAYSISDTAFQLLKEAGVKVRKIETTT